MPGEIRFAIRFFNVLASFIALVIFVTSLEETQRSSILSPGRIASRNAAELLIVFTLGLSAASAFICSFFPYGWARMLWRDAQFRLAWMVSVGMANCLLFCFQNWPRNFGDQIGASMVSAAIVGIASLSIQCAAQTRAYLR